LGTPIIIGLSGFYTAYVIQGALLVELVASCSQVIPLFCVLAKRLHQPFKQAVCDDRRQCHQ
ncbi:hypothetical protein ACUOAQ_04795, partial [Escherichia sp. SP-MK]